MSKTYEDFLEVVEKENELKDFIELAINEHKSSNEYKEAKTSYEYYKKKNVTIMEFVKILYKVTGEKVPDKWSANYKLRNAFYPFFIRQEVSHLLGNGVTFNKKETKEALGGDMLDVILVDLAKKALWGGEAFGFFNKDTIEPFSILEFVPLVGEEDGALHAGIRFWQIAPNKPLRATLYEQDGYTEYIKRTGEKASDDYKFEVLEPKRDYILTVEKSKAKGVTILEGRNYPSFPIVPLWGNEVHQTELEGIRERLDCFDLIDSGFANDLDEASFIYWLIHNTGGADETDLAKFVERMKTVKAAYVDDDGSTAEAHTIDVPFESRKYMLEHQREQLFFDAMALDTRNIASGNITATAVNASYENLTQKCDDFETLVTTFLKAVLELAGIEDSPTYKRSKIVNMLEDTQMVLAAAQYLDDETILKHLPFLNPDEINDVLKRLTKEEAERFVDDGQSEELDGQGTPKDGEGNPQAVQTGEQGNN